MADVTFKTALQQRSCEACQRGHHGECGYMVEFEEINAGAGDAEDFIDIRPWCICYKSTKRMHQSKREEYEERQTEASFVEQTMQQLPPEASELPHHDQDHPDILLGGVLSDRMIYRHLSYGSVKIFPFEMERLGPASYDLTLHPEIGRVNLPSVVDLKDIPEHYVRMVRIREETWDGPDDDPYDLMPGDFVLASTIETIGIPTSLAARVEGKSSLARLGLAVHVTGGFIDPGFEGQITLEMVNLSGSVLRLWPGIPIAQIAFMPVVGEVTRPYGTRGHYQHQQGPTASRYTV